MRTCATDRLNDESLPQGACSHGVSVRAGGVVCGCTVGPVAVRGMHMWKWECISGRVTCIGGRGAYTSGRGHGQVDG